MIWLNVSNLFLLNSFPWLDASRTTDNGLCKTGNILPSLNAAPALQANAKELERSMRADSLEHKIQNRPQPEELISMGILEEGEDPRASNE